MAEETECSDEPDIDAFEKELEEAQKDIDKAFAEAQTAVAVYEKMQVEYEKYKKLEQQLAENPPNADDIRREMEALEQKADALLDSIQPAKDGEK